MTPIPSLLVPLALGVAHAQALPSVAVVGAHIEGLDTSAGEQLASELVTALESGGKVDALTTDEVAALLRGREELVLDELAVRRGAASLTDGRALYSRADYDGAIPLLERAARRLQDGLVVVGEPRDLVDAWLELGVARASIGDETGAVDVWSQVAVLDPSRALDPVAYPPKMVDLFQEARDAVLAEDGANLSVRVDGGAEEILVDGRVAPGGTAERLPPGLHHVWVRGLGGSRGYATVELQAGESRELELELGPGRFGPEAQSPVQRAILTQELYRALGEYADVDLVLVAGETGEGSVSLCLYAPRSRSFSKAMTGEHGGDPAGTIVDLVPALTGYVSEAGNIRADRVSPQVPPMSVEHNVVLRQMLFDPEPAIAPAVAVAVGDDGDAEGGSRWLLWAGAGAVVAGGGATAAVLMTREPTGTLIFGPIE